jgi:hypothetical protein
MRSYLVCPGLSHNPPKLIEKRKKRKKKKKKKTEPIISHFKPKRNNAKAKGKKSAATRAIRIKNVTRQIPAPFKLARGVSEAQSHVSMGN